MDKRKKIFIIALFLVVFGLIEVPKEYAYLTSEKTTGIIYSEGYYKRIMRIGSKNYHYLYKVQYAVNGKNYTSDAFETQSDTYKKGDIVDIHYNPQNPQIMVKKWLPFSWFIFIVGIGVIIRLNKEE